MSTVIFGIKTAQLVIVCVQAILVTYFIVQTRKQIKSGRFDFDMKMTLNCLACARLLFLIYDGI